MSFFSKLSRLAFTILEDLEHPAGRIFNLGIAGLILVSTGIFVAETYPLAVEIKATLDIIDNGILILFSIEYALRFLLAERKIKYLFSLYSLIDLVTILPFLLGFANFRFVRILRWFRWFRILRLVRFLEETPRRDTAGEDNLITLRIVFTLFSIIFVYSGLIYQVEHPVNAEAFGTFLDAIYFSVATMTTVGFGDITPISETGRLLTVLMILTGIALIPWQIGDLIKKLVKVSNSVAIQCPGCGYARHDEDAFFCKVCGTSLPPKVLN